MKSAPRTLDRLHSDARRTRLIYGLAIIAITIITTYLFLATSYPRAAVSGPGTFTQSTQDTNLLPPANP